MPRRKTYRESGPRRKALPAAGPVALVGPLLAEGASPDRSARIAAHTRG